MCMGVWFFSLRGKGYLVILRNLTINRSRIKAVKANKNRFSHKVMESLGALAKFTADGLAVFEIPLEMNGFLLLSGAPEACYTAQLKFHFDGFFQSFEQFPD